MRTNQKDTDNGLKHSVDRVAIYRLAILSPDKARKGVIVLRKLTHLRAEISERTFTL